MCVFVFRHYLVKLDRLVDLIVSIFEAGHWQRHVVRTEAEPNLEKKVEVNTSLRFSPRQQALVVPLSLVDSTTCCILVNYSNFEIN